MAKVVIYSDDDLIGKMQSGRADLLGKKSLQTRSSHFTNLSPISWTLAEIQAILRIQY